MCLFSSFLFYFFLSLLLQSKLWTLNLFSENLCSDCTSEFSNESSSEVRKEKHMRLPGVLGVCHAPRVFKMAGVISKQGGQSSNLFSR